MDVIDFVMHPYPYQTKRKRILHKTNDVSTRESPVFIQLLLGQFSNYKPRYIPTFGHCHMVSPPLLEYTIYSSLSIHPSVSPSLFRLFHTTLVRTTHVLPISRTCHSTVRPDIDFSSVFHRETNDERNKSRLYFLASDTYDCPPCFCIRQYNPP